jgi:hypothetical protein
MNTRRTASIASSPLADDVGSIAEPLQHQHRDLLVHHVVIGDQDPQRSPTMTG